MASVSDFLFNGQAPKSVTTYGTSVQNLPQWFSDFQQGIAAKGNAIAAQPYEAYGAPRIAGFTNDQTNSFNQIRQGQGQEAGAIKNSMQNASLVGATADASGDAAPWLGRAGQNSYDVVNNYMNPYTDAVVDRIGDLGARNLNEKLMPAINSDFIRAGQYGSTGMMAETGRALRDVSEGVLAEQNKALQAGYGMALDSAAGDMDRFGQIGQTVGNLSNADSEMQLNSSKVSGALGTVAQDARYKDIEALGNVGDAQQGMNQSNLDLAYQDFVDQRDYQKNQLGWVNNLIKGYQVPTSTYMSKDNYDIQYDPSPLQSALGAGLTTYNLLK